MVTTTNLEYCDGRPLKERYAPFNNAYREEVIRMLSVNETGNSFVRRACGHSRHLPQIQDRGTGVIENQLLTPLTRSRDHWARRHATCRTSGQSVPSPPTWSTVQHTVPEDHHRNTSTPCPGRSVGVPYLTPQTATP